MKEKTLQEVFKIWDDGGFTFDGNLEDIVTLEEGKPLGKITEKWTKCPVHNGTCLSLTEIEIPSFNPDKGLNLQKIALCPLGVENIDGCPLSK
jgi:hypothetical protein